MDDTFANAQKDGQGKEDSLHSLSHDRELSGDQELDYSQSKSRRLIRRVNSHQYLLLKVKQLQRSKSCIKDSFLRSIRVLDNWIPKHIITIDEKYLRRCLEFIHASTSQAVPCNASMYLDWGNKGFFSDGLDIAKIGNQNTCSLAGFDFDCPLAGTGSLVISPAEQWIAGSIMDSKSMLNILKSPLLRRYGAYDGDGNFEKVISSDVKGSICYDFMDSPGGLSSYSSHKLDNRAQIPGSNKYESESLHKRFVSMTSTNSTCSDQSSSSPSAAVTRGTLQCMWKGGNPCFIFSLDDQKVVYVANFYNVDSADDKALEYIYLFHSRKGGQEEDMNHDKESRLVGQMKVSTSFALCPNNCRIMKREFVLFGCYENSVGELQSSSHDPRKNKGLSSRVVEVFRTNNSIKKRTNSRFDGSVGAILENSSWEPFQLRDNNMDALGGANLLENHLPPNLELAAILVRDLLPEKRPEKAGGWGLNFLKNETVPQVKDTMKSSVLSACCAQDTSDCSTSIDILIPAGLHGGPRTRNGGPSSLIDRWRSGYCDCGGWDLGCPLTVLKSRSANKEFSSSADMQGECKLINLFIQGSENGAPPLRMVNVHDGVKVGRFMVQLDVVVTLLLYHSASWFIFNQASFLCGLGLVDLVSSALKLLEEKGADSNLRSGREQTPRPQTASTLPTPQGALYSAKHEDLVASMDVLPGYSQVCLFKYSKLLLASIARPQRGVHVRDPAQLAISSIPLRRGGSAGNKFRMSLGLPVAATVNCADNTGAKNLYIISVKGIKGRLNRLPSACVGDMVMATVKKGKPDLRKKVMPAVIVRQRKPWRRKDGVFMYFEEVELLQPLNSKVVTDNAGVIVNPKGEMKGSAITGPIGKECADLWPRIASAANAIV
ncbi:hypothetical protein SADUNF_Sadunf10G0041700 [Salix dunnii]|uniref:60S ribosomal protein L23 n=1 Tax=Salix dunnii TaxID=1413687 RepID=A0A835JLT9_9ROSI|nr:hypothetical protein SADUNF_Sadunf10G0041700 [Salix dunnii]